jgi:Ca-activated chloride channel homolog
MDLSLFHFSQPLWLWELIAIPLLWTFLYCVKKTQHPLHHLEKFIDSHLLPYLLKMGKMNKDSLWRSLLLWSLVWACLTLALAGPRWNFREMESFSRDQSLVILLDLSESMNAVDIKPSRLIRAKQKIEDLLNNASGVKFGLIAFAADPHMIAPITDDKETLRHLLPPLETDLVYVQGSRLSPALKMASNMLQAESGANKAILIISDGGFEDTSAITVAKKMAEEGTYLYTMGVGTLAGAPLQDHEGNLIKKNEAPIISKLESEALQEISRIGDGRYLETQPGDQDESIIISDLEARAEAQLELGKKNRIWDEHFYLLLFLALPIFLWWFRRGAIIGILLFFFSPSLEASDYFKNSEQRGQQALEASDYETASNTFQDPYRKGVAYYRAGDFAEAEKMFRQSSREEVACQAGYNLGNSLTQQQKLKEAAEAYENLLKKWPDHAKAKENLELVKKMMEEQEKEQSEKEKNKDKDQEQKASEDCQQEEERESDKEDQQGKNSDSGEQEQQQQQAKPEEMDGEEQKSEEKSSRSEEDQDADQWLNRIENDPKTFLKNKFYLESKRDETKETIDPW